MQAYWDYLDTISNPIVIKAPLPLTIKSSFVRSSLKSTPIMIQKEFRCRVRNIRRLEAKTVCLKESDQNSEWKHDGPGFYQNGITLKNSLQGKNSLLRPLGKVKTMESAHNLVSIIIVTFNWPHDYQWILS